MKLSHISKRFKLGIVTTGLMVTAVVAMAQPNGHNHGAQPQVQALTRQQSELLKTIRENTERFQDPLVAEKEGYHLMFGCVSGPDSGAMGLHYVNLDLVGAGTIDPTRPQIVIYEPAANGKLKLIGADFLVIAGDWDKAHPKDGPPQLAGQLFHYFEAPNRFGLPAFYTLHVWAWKENSNGTFVNWHPNVSCTAYSPQ